MNDAKSKTKLLKSDRQSIWHPYTPVLGTEEPVLIASGKGAHVYDFEGTQYIDAVASWWTNLHGHAHPYIAKKIYEQALQLEQVIFAGFTHAPAITLAEMLLSRIPYHHKIFYSDNGSTAVEAALKMALQYWWNRGEERHKIIAFDQAYHGDTFGAMSIGSRGLFNKPFAKLLFDVEFIATPTAGNEEQTIADLQLKVKDSEIAAFIYEPLVLGSSGMLMYGENTLNELLGICKANGIITIADEVMTGFGRTGKFLASDYCDEKPDIICLSKGITGGFLPFAATSCNESIFEAFSTAERSKMFFHGHSYTGNPLGCAAGIASLELFEKENTFKQIDQIGQMHQYFAEYLDDHPCINNIRHRGTILAIEIKTEGNSGYLNDIRDRAYLFFLDYKIILRPLGNVIYILPPYCISKTDLENVYTSIVQFLKELQK